MGNHALRHIYYRQFNIKESIFELSSTFCFCSLLFPSFCQYSLNTFLKHKILNWLWFQRIYDIKGRLCAVNNGHRQKKEYSPKHKLHTMHAFRFVLIDAHFNRSLALKLEQAHSKNMHDQSRISIFFLLNKSAFCTQTCCSFK